MNRLAAYAAPGLPLAMSALPVYVLAPKLYADTFGLPLALTGAVLMIARLFDTLQDPWLGTWIDRLTHQQSRWRKVLWLCVWPMIIGLFALVSPPLAALNQTLLALWLGVWLVVVYCTHSLVQIAYFGYGAAIPQQYPPTAVTGWRESAGLVGVIIGAILPGVLTPWLGENGGLLVFASMFSILMIVGMRLWLSSAPPAEFPPHVETFHWRDAFTPLQDRSFRLMCVLYLVVALGNAIPSTLLMFYVEDTLGIPGRSWIFLTLYFVAGGLGMALWVRLGQIFSTDKAWMIGLLAAAMAFAGAATLGQGDGVAFGVICVITGLSLGADLVLPPVLVAKAIRRHGGGNGGAYFGVWSLVGKVSMALAAGLALPLLAGLGYRPGQIGHPALPLVYAGLPFLLRIVGAAALWVMIREEQKLATTPAVSQAL